jgi:hypothetical protein
VIETYEELRDSATGEARSAWQSADRMERELADYYRNLQEDVRYVDSHKAELAWQRYEERKEKIAAHKQRAKEGLQAKAEQYRMQAIPFPPEHGLITASDNAILMTQNELTRISRTVDRRQAQASGPLKVSVTDMLKEEYTEGMKRKGTHGAAICRATVDACSEYGVDVDSVVDSHRKAHHRSLIEQAQQSEIMGGSIGGTLKEPPFPHPRRARLTNFASRGASAAAVKGQPWDVSASPREAPSQADEGTVTVIGGTSSSEAGGSHVEKETAQRKSKRSSGDTDSS